MLMRASIKPSSMLLNNQIIEINRGEIVFSQENFAKRNNMTRQQLRTFIKKLKISNMVKSSPNSNQQVTHLFIVEYNNYNELRNNQHLTNTQPGFNHIIKSKKVRKKEINKDFDLFWEHYPKKVGKKKVQDKFNANEYPIEKILKNLEKQKQSTQWQNPQYIPNPETYLNQERWEDEVMVEVKSDDPIFVYQCPECNNIKAQSEYADMYISCCGNQIQYRKEYK